MIIRKTKDGRVIQMTIFQQIKDIRLKKGLTVEELSKLAGVTEFAINKIESGDGLVLFSVLVKMANALNCKIAIQKKDIIIKEKVDKTVAI